MGLSMIDIEIIVQIVVVVDFDVLEVVWIVLFGKSGLISVLLKMLGGMMLEQCQVEGSCINGLCIVVIDVIVVCKVVLEGVVFDVCFVIECFDMSLFVFVVLCGLVYFVSQVMDEFVEIFVDMGFVVVIGFEIEDQWYNFMVFNMFEIYLVCVMYDIFYLEVAEGEEVKVFCIYISFV